METYNPKKRIILNNNDLPVKLLSFFHPRAKTELSADCKLILTLIENYHLNVREIATHSKIEEIAITRVLKGIVRKLAPENFTKILRFYCYLSMLD